MSTSQLPVIKTCATCTYRKNPVCLSMRFLQACGRISKDPDKVNAHTLAMLIHEAESMSHRKYKCTKEPTAWTHLMDRACAFWQPVGEGGILSCT